MKKECINRTVSTTAKRPIFHGCRRMNLYRIWMANSTRAHWVPGATDHLATAPVTVTTTLVALAPGDARFKRGKLKQPFWRSVIHVVNDNRSAC